MKPDGLLRRMAIALAMAVVIYAIGYFWIEHLRARHGPWRVTFTNDVARTPMLLINQPRLAITNFEIIFRGAILPTNAALEYTFDGPRPVPYQVPFGKCLFMDTTFLPGTIAFDLFGHEIQLLPRVLTIDKKEQAWQPNLTIALPVANQP